MEKYLGIIEYNSFDERIVLIKKSPLTVRVTAETKQGVELKSWIETYPKNLQKTTASFLKEKGFVLN